MFKSVDKKSDEELVSLAIENSDYFLLLVRRYEDKLTRYISRISNLDKDEIDDILQDIFIKVYKNLNAFDTSLKFSSWIYRISHNEVISNYRKFKDRAKIISFDGDGEFIKNIADNLDIEKEISLEDLKSDVSLVLNKIDMKYREVLILRFMEGNSYNEISDILKKSEGTVATLLNRAKKQFLMVLQGNSNLF